MYWCAHPQAPSLFPSPSHSLLDSPYFTVMSHDYCYFHFRSKFCLWAKTWDIWLFEFGLPCSTWWSLVPSIFLQTTQFHSSLWLNDIPSCMCTTSSLSTHQLLGTSWFHSLAVTNSDTINVNVEIVWWFTLLWIYSCDFSRKKILLSCPDEGGLVTCQVGRRGGGPVAFWRVLVRWELACSSWICPWIWAFLVVISELVCSLSIF